MRARLQPSSDGRGPLGGGHHKAHSEVGTTKHNQNTPNTSLNTTKHKPEHNRTPAAVPEPRTPNTAQLCLKHVCLETLNTTKH